MSESECIEVVIAEIENCELTDERELVPDDVLRQLLETKASQLNDARLNWVLVRNRNTAGLGLDVLRNRGRRGCLLLWLLFLLRRGFNPLWLLHVR